MTETSINFFDIKKKEKDYLWKIETIRTIHKRRYNFKHSSMEIFFQKSRKFVFFNFPTMETRNEVYEKIQKHKFINIDQSKYNYSGNDPTKWIEKTQVVKQWQEGKLTNFEYLMYLNTISGRTYQDVSQYPIFPWIVCDYGSEKLDLEHPETFRDLSKPIGKLNNKIMTYFEKYQKKGKEKEIQFNYHKYYSNPEIVSSYLVRLEPFTSIFLQGKYAIFKSIPETWKTIKESNNDFIFGELIPEFFHLPDFLRKPTVFKQENEAFKQIANVELPKWAKTPEEFIRKHKEALESEYVSQHLNEWIDLIFGYKQKGEEAKKALNLFHPNLYEENADFSELEQIRKEIQAKGQVPIQLFTKKHPKRLSKKEIQQKSFPFSFSLSLSSSAGFQWGNISLSESFHSTKFKISSNPIIFINFQEVAKEDATPKFQHQITTIDKERILGKHGWEFLNKPNSKNRFFNFYLHAMTEKQAKIGVSFSQDFHNLQGSFQMDKNLRFLICCGFCDDTFKIFDAENYKMTQSVSRHKDIVNCLAIDSRYLVTGSKDTTVIVWEFSLRSGKVRQEPQTVFFEHEKEVRSVALSVDYDIVLSGSVDGKLIFHSLNKAKASNIITFSENSKILRLFTINGYLIKEETCSQNIYAISITQDSSVVFLGGDKGIFETRNLFDLQLIRFFDFKEKIYSLSIIEKVFIVMIGLGNGQIKVGNFIENKK
ncbi:beige/beach-related [Anaeramoeba ignava]|uniref:Beige/beach-related n=1 Tax=Anaeramoeba ignava TaxID=1746090 RepID=A0A9Q0LIQ4_ANAIG|nr:beige/beach-related [Anaeramoeba ignava]